MDESALHMLSVLMVSGQVLTVEWLPSRTEHWGVCALAFPGDRVQTHTCSCMREVHVVYD